MPGLKKKSIVIAPFLFFIYSNHSALDFFTAKNALQLIGILTLLYPLRKTDVDVSIHSF